MTADLAVAPSPVNCGGCSATADECYVLRDDCCNGCTHYPEPVDDDVDEIAVERAVGGDRSITLTRDEHREAFARLDRRGLDNAAIGRLLGVSSDLVLRWRRGDCRPNHRPAIQERPMNITSTESATDALLRRAAQSESTRIRRAAERVTEALDRLRAEFAEDESKREARERVARLEAELKAAKAALRSGKPVTPKVRAQTAMVDGGIPCPNDCGKVSVNAAGASAHARFCTVEKAS